MIRRDLEPDDDLGPLFDRRSEGERRRDDGCERVLENAGDDWRSQVHAVVRHIAATRATFTIEDVRSECVILGVPEPHHPNAWGAVLRGVDGIAPTGHFVTNGSASAHSRNVREWSALKDGGAE